MTYARLWRWAGVTLLLVLAAAPAHAVTQAVTATIRYVGPGSNCGVAGFWVDLDGDGTYDETYNNNVYVGEYRFAFKEDASSPEAAALLSNPFYAWCIDVAQEAPTSWSLYELANLEDAPVNGWGSMGTDRANRLRELFGRFLPEVDSKAEGEAFAAAIWEIVYERDDSYNLNTGTLRMNGLDWGAGDIAEGWLASLDGDTQYFDYNLFALTNPTHQDFALTTPGVGGMFVVVPEPATMAGMVLGVGSLVGYLRRRRG